MTILLTLSVYQLSLYNLLPTKSSTLPYVGTDNSLLTSQKFLYVYTAKPIGAVYKPDLGQVSGEVKGN